MPIMIVNSYISSFRSKEKKFIYGEAMLLDVFTFGYVIAFCYTDPYHDELIIFISN